MNLNVEELAIHSILPVSCGSKHGTAFVIDDHHLLTAWHVASEYFDDDQEPIIVGNGEDVFSCLGIQLGKSDITLLKTDYALSADRGYNYLSLLSSSFKKDLPLTIVGYPQELGNGVDYFSVEVRNLRKLQNANKGFDTLVVRTDALGFHSYKGFSGSPVLNEFGHVIGVVTDQLHNSLGYTSILSVANLLKVKGISINRNDDEEDTTDYGLGFCIKYNEQAIKRAGNRFNKDFNVENKGGEANISWICHVGHKEIESTILKKLEEWKEKVTSIEMRGALIDIFGQNANFNRCNIDNELIDNLEKLYERRSNNSISYNGYVITGSVRYELEGILKETRWFIEAKYFYVTKNSFFYLIGPAGTGKTHLLCQMAKDLSHKTRVYLLFGLDFNDVNEPLAQMLNIIGWKETDAIERLYEKLNRDNLHATFILDGLNEGVGATYWQSHIQNLREYFEKFKDRISIIISIRRPGYDDTWKGVLKRWQGINISGFENPRNAIDAFFKEYRLPNSDKFYTYSVFSNPLYLSAYCKGYLYLDEETKDRPNELGIFKAYASYCNRSISHYVDEDPLKDLTSVMLLKLTELSIEKHKCLNIPHEQAYNLSNTLLPYRSWSKSLLYNMVNENILREYSTNNNRHFVTFEYDDMGNFYKARYILLKHDEHINDYDALSRFLSCFSLYLNCKDNSEKQEYYNILTTALSIWNPSTDFWEILIKNRTLSRLILESLPKRNMIIDNLNGPIISEILKKYASFTNPITILSSHLYDTSFIETIHDFLKEKDMLERDQAWSIRVNRLLDEKYFPFALDRFQPDDKYAKQFAILLCWMLSSSHPYIRSVIIRKVKSIFDKHNDFILEFIDKFYNVNDPYVTRGLFAAIYGCVLLSNNIDLIGNVSKSIFEKYYKDKQFIPYDIELRSWTLRIIQYAYERDKTNDYWNKIDLKIEHSKDLFNFNDTDNVSDKLYFGKGRGEAKIYNSLFTWDFYRYIIGGDNNFSRVYYKNQLEAVKTLDIAHAVANVIRDEYKYSSYPIICQYDASVPFDPEPNKLHERFGKKYEWLGLAKVKAFMLDDFMINEQPYNNFVKLEGKHYPWYDDKSSHFDPTFNNEKNDAIITDECIKLFDDFTQKSTINIEYRRWMEEEKLYVKPQIIYKSKKKDEWILLVGYDNLIEEENENAKRTQSLIYNSFFVEQDEAYKFETWAKLQNFYGRWMPEDTGQYHFLWNEYPWADTYKSKKTYNDLGKEYLPKNMPSKIILSYSAQVQENNDGVFDKDNIIYTAYMLPEEFYEKYDLYNAERGIIRDRETNDIVAINYKISENKLDGLMIRKDILDKYMKEKKYVLFYDILGEKYVDVGLQYLNMKRYSSCIKYAAGSESFYSVQQMTEEKNFKK